VEERRFSAHAILNAGFSPRHSTYTISLSHEPESTPKMNLGTISAFHGDHPAKTETWSAGRRFPEPASFAI